MMTSIVHLVWRGVAWCGVVWCGGVGCGVVWCGVVQPKIQRGGGSVLRRATTSRCYRTSAVVRLVYLRYNINTGCAQCGDDGNLG